jgi:hypothetical protein
MSTLAKLSGAGDSAVLPGYRLSPMEMSDFGELEREFELHALGTAAALARALPEQMGERAVQRAEKKVDEGYWAWGGLGFDSEALKLQNAPLLLYMELRRRHPDVTRDAADKLWREHPRQGSLHDTILDFAGYSKSRKKGVSSEGMAATLATAEAESPSTSERFSGPSGSAPAGEALSATQTSAA